MSDALRAVPFDPAPLTQPVDRGDVRRFAKEIAARNPRTVSARVAIEIGVVLAAGLVLVALLAGTALVSGEESAEGPRISSLLPLLVFAAIPLAAVVVFALSRRRLNERRYRLDRFARANGMTYIPFRGAPPLPGMIFGIGRNRKVDDLVRASAPRFVEFGDYQYTTGSGKQQTTHRWGYVAIRLDAPLPHIVLDALGNNSVFGSNLPVGFDRDQRLSLEGDFDDHFALYCPEGYETDALYLFTPDIMARFLDNVGRFDVEIVDEWMLLYTRRRVSTLDPATWAWLFSVATALVDKLAQWGRWRDERLAGEPAAAPISAPAAPAPSTPTPVLTPPRGVAPQGRRLKRGFRWGPVIVGAAVIVWMLQRVWG